MEIRKEVEKMAREMEISEISPTKPLDHEKLFMDKETDKVFGEIDTLKNTQISDLLSPRSSKSLKSILSTGKTEMSISEITMNEFSNHKSFSLELVQMDLFGET